MIKNEYKKWNREGESMKLVQVMKNMRKKQKITQEELCRGLCSRAVLSRIEKQEKQSDRMLLEALFERLGTTLLYWDKILNNNDMRLYQMQIQIEGFIEEGDCEQAEKLLEQYEDFRGVNVSLHKQYKTWTKARISQLKGNGKESLKYAKEALLYTIPEFDGEKFEIKNYYLCYQELQIYFMWLQLQRDYEKQEIGPYLEELLRFIEERMKDERYLEQLIPVLLYEIAKIKWEKGDVAYASSLCRRAVKIQRKNERLEHLKELLELQIQIEEKQGLEVNLKELKEWYQAVVWIEKYGEDLEKSEQIMRNKSNVYSIGQIFRNLRKENHLRQDDFMGMEQEGVHLVRETISRAENGRKNPTKKTCERYLSQFDKKMQFYSSRIESDEYESYELQALLGKKIKQEEVKEAKEILEQLEEKLDLTNPYNMQYIRKEKLFLNYLEKRIDEKRYRKSLIDILKLYIKDYNMLEKREKVCGYLNRNEIEIINNIAISYANEKDYDSSIQWYKKLIHYFEEKCTVMSAIDYIMILTNYSNILGNCGKYRESTDIARRGIQIRVKNKNGSLIPHLLYEIAWNYKEEGKITMLLSEEKEECMITFHMSCVISALFQQKNFSKFLELQQEEFTALE